MAEMTKQNTLAYLRESVRLVSVRLTNVDRAGKSGLGTDQVAGPTKEFDKTGIPVRGVQNAISVDTTNPTHAVSFDRAWLPLT
jgi:hypothetical protein